MATTVAQPGIRVLPKRRRVVRAVIILTFVYVRSLIATAFLLKTFFGKINGAACLRERVTAAPALPFWMMVKLKWLYLRGVWTATPDGHAERIEASFNRHIAKVEDYVEKHYQAVTKETPLPEYDWRTGTPQDFFEKFVKTPQPVVLRGFALQTEAVKEWNFDYIVEKCGEVDVNLTTSDRDYTGKLKEVRDPRIYCANADAPFKAFPELSEQLSIPKLQPYLNRQHTFDQMFIGRSSTGSGYHCAGIWNFFVMVDGKKKWTFVDPEFTWMVYPSMVNGALAYASMTSFPDRADLSHYRLYKYCPRFFVELNPGDVLFNPPWWWHCVHNLTATSVAVATRWDALRGDFSFYEINRVLAALAIFNPTFPGFLYDYAMTHAGEGRHLVRAGAGAFEEDDMEKRNQHGRDRNAYHGNIVRKLQLKRKW